MEMWNHFPSHTNSALNGTVWACILISSWRCLLLLIGQSNYFDIAFSTVIWNPLTYRISDANCNWHHCTGHWRLKKRWHILLHAKKVENMSSRNLKLKWSVVTSKILGYLQWRIERRCVFFLLLRVQLRLVINPIHDVFSQHKSRLLQIR